MLAPRGRLILLGFLAGGRLHRRPRPDPAEAARSDRHDDADPRLDERAPLVREFTERMLPLFDQRIEHAAPLRPVLERTYPMTELADAHRVLESNETFGKVVVRW